MQQIRELEGLELLCFQSNTTCICPIMKFYHVQHTHKHTDWHLTNFHWQRNDTNLNSNRIHFESSNFLQKSNSFHQFFWQRNIMVQVDGINYPVYIHVNDTDYEVWVLFFSKNSFCPRIFAKTHTHAHTHTHTHTHIHTHTHTHRVTFFPILFVII